MLAHSGVVKRRLPWSVSLPEQRRETLRPTIDDTDVTERLKVLRDAANGDSQRLKGGLTFRVPTPGSEDEATIFLEELPHFF
jgi:hypothetical protein